MRPYVLLTLIVAFGVPSSVGAVEEERRGGAGKIRSDVPRVRAVDSRVATALEYGIARSASFREVLSRVNQLDVIVYAETQPTIRSRFSGSMQWVAATKDFRYVRVSLNPELTLVQLVATLAHELQHVAEVGGAPSVVDTRTLSEFYRGVDTLRRTTSDEWETDAAQRVGYAVRRELAQGGTARVAESIQN